MLQEQLYKLHLLRMQQITPTFIKLWQQRKIAGLSISQQWNYVLIFFLCGILFLQKKELKPAALIFCNLFCAGFRVVIPMKKNGINKYKLQMMWVGDAVDACNL